MVLAGYVRMFQMRKRDVIRLLVVPAVTVVVLAGAVIAAIVWRGR
jgi:hypothetical protein